MFVTPKYPCIVVAFTKIIRDIVRRLVPRAFVVCNPGELGKLHVCFSRLVGQTIHKQSSFSAAPNALTSGSIIIQLL